MPTHLILLIHGLFGSPRNLEVLEEELRKAHTDHHTDSSQKLSILVAKSFTGGHTWDGIDVNAWRASQEIDEEIDRLEGEGEEVTRFSVIGYSLGGRELPHPCLHHTLS